MEKRHIAKVLGFETIYAFVISMVLGIILGMLLDRLMYLIILKVLDAAVPLGFYISWSGIGYACGLFGVIFFLIFLNSLRQIYKAKPVDLLKSDNFGEKEPKAKWILAVLGLICLVSGYFIAVTTENPVAAFALFFIAVILVIVGTYLLFTAGSIALLKILRKNKGYYYKTKHFISVSGMMYRMKRNAVGLANICILSTMVLVMVSATLFMFLGLDDSLAKRYPTELSIKGYYPAEGDSAFDKSIANLKKSFDDEGLELKDEILYSELSFSSVYDEDANEYITDQSKFNSMSTISAYNNLRSLMFITLDDYNSNMHKHETLEDENEVLVYSNRVDLESDEINVFDKSFKVKKELDSFPESGSAVANITATHFIVVKDISVMNDLHIRQAEVSGEHASFIQHHYMANVAGDSEKNADKIIAAYDRANAIITSDDFGEFSGYMECRSKEAPSFGTDFAGLFFIGIFLGVLFIMATVLIMYYKQITEGYEDKKRFEIMQNVGMTHKEVKKSINAQILTVFFLPLITAGVHIAFAFPFIYRIMALMSLYNLHLVAVCTIGCFLVFALFYTVVYILTAKLYYGIVKK